MTSKAMWNPRWVVLMLAMLLAAPAIGLAQSGAIAGAVRDATGAVLPGVTVEAASPALIEKVRTAVTDDQGQYKILDLRPGVFVVTFTLPGFRTIRREGIELSAGGTVNIPAQMEVGAVEETVTVTGQTPLVDVQNVTAHRVLTQDVLEALPTARSVFGVSALIPGMSLSVINASNPRDIGGNASAANLAVRIHGSRDSDSLNLVDGMRYNNLNGSGGGSRNGWNPNAAVFQEVVVDVGGHTAEDLVAGPRVNPIPKDGGNTFRGTFIGNFSNHNLQAVNITPELQARGLAAVPGMKNLWEVNPMLGGPIKRDKLWFYGGVRYIHVEDVIPGVFFDKDPLDFVYTPDLTRPTPFFSFMNWQDLRLTWQATPRNKFGFYGDNQTRVQPNQFRDNTAPEALLRLNFPPSYLAQTTYNSPITNKLLVEAGMTVGGSAFQMVRQPGQPADLLGVTDLATGLRYRAGTVVIGNTGTSSRNRTFYLNVNTRAKVSYVTGSHAFQVGMQSMHGYEEGHVSPDGADIGLLFLRVVPVAVQVFTTPFVFRNTLNYDLGLFAQDQWTINRLTLNVGVRFDFMKSSVPEQHYPAVRFVGARDFAAIDNVPNWKDVSPRLGAAYDLFGNGKTAVKASLGRYVESAAAGIAKAVNPFFSTINTTTRPWTDRNGDFFPQEDELGPLANPNFGKLNVINSFDPDYLTGWGKRLYNWELLAGVTHELRPGLSVTADYIRHWYGNFLVDDNVLVGPSDYSPFCVTAPVDPRLPGGGGNEICGFYDINPEKFGQFKTVTTFAKNFGKQTDVYTGVDLTVNMRLPRGVILQGGTSTGHQVQDNCDVVGKVDNSGGVVGAQFGIAGSNLSTVASPSTLYCHIAPAFKTQVKFLGVLPLPWWGLTASATFQSVPGDLRVPSRVVDGYLANYAVPNAVVAPSLGRPLSGGANFTTVQLIQPGSMYGDRVNQVDVRGSKTFTVGRIRIQALVDLYNLLNVSPVLQQNDTYGPTWQKPQNILPGRFIKFGTQIDF